MRFFCGQGCIQPEITGQISFDEVSIKPSIVKFALTAYWYRVFIV